MHIHIVNVQIKYLSDNEFKKKNIICIWTQYVILCHYCTWIVKCHLVVTIKKTPNNVKKNKKKIVKLSH